MFGNDFLDSLPEYGILQNIIDKCDNQNAIDLLPQNIRAFIVVKKYLQQVSGQQVSIASVVEATAVNFDSLWLIAFLIAYNEGYQRISITSESIIYQP